MNPYAAYGAADAAPEGNEALLARAVAAMSADGSEAGALLASLLEKDPGNTVGHWLLGVNLAQDGDSETAESHLRQAVALQPDLAMARFQLGLLQLTCGRPADAAGSWGPLDLLPQDHCLVHFKTGLLCLAKDEFEAARSCIERGLAQLADGEPLARDMAMVLEEIARRQAAPAEEAEEDGEHVLLSAYRDGSA